MATHGSVSAFDPSKEDWTTYEERLRYYFVANDVTDGAKKRSILLAACGAPAYKLIRSLVQAEKLDSTPYEVAMSESPELCQFSSTEAISQHCCNVSASN